MKYFFSDMGKLRLRRVMAKVVRRGLTGPRKFQLINPSVFETRAGASNITASESDDMSDSPTCTETAYIKAKKKELDAWNVVSDDMLKVSFELEALINTFCMVCSEAARYRCMECSTTAVFCEGCVKNTHTNSMHIYEKWNVSNMHSFIIHN